ncbi:unnamed protein product [Ilex paraguariensis]|uniref:RPW8 domain-containing protein n=1 Tax=Ilex paraguariensis TaxID=185542 RepID=A0ABC8UWK5_9AQUA
MADLILGAVVGELLAAVIEATKQAINFKSSLDNLKTTLIAIQPFFDEIEKLNKLLDARKEETGMFIDRLKEGKNLVLKCSTIKSWNVYKKIRYNKKLTDLDSSLLRFFQIDVQALMARDSKKILVGVNDNDQKLDRILSILKNGVGGSRYSNGVSGSCTVPGVPHFIVGLDVPLQELKVMLLKDEVSVVVLSAPGGCGKTTLAKMLGRDDEIKAIYGANIFFVNVSKTPNIKVMVQKLFQHQGCHQLPEFQSDDDAINQLENFLEQKGHDRILLVLDDVWPGSESLIQDFKFQIPGYKILVTSRSELTGFDSTYRLKLLNDQDAITLFRHLAFPQDGTSNVPDDLVNEVVKGCGGFPLALTVVARSLYKKHEVIWRSTVKKWSEGQSIFDSNTELLKRLQTSLDALEEMPIVKECYVDLGSFPEDQRIPASALKDMWVEMYNLDEDGMDTLVNLIELSNRNLANLVLTRKDSSEVDDYCNEQFVTQHDLLRELAIYQSNRAPIEQRTRLIMDISGNNHPRGWIEQISQPIHAHLLSISTDETFSSSCYDLQVPEVKILILNFRTGNFTLPQFLERMDRLKVLIITNYGFSPAELNDFLLLGYLSNLKRIRLEHVSIPSLSTSVLELRNLRKISLIMCEIAKAFENCTMELPHLWPNLEHMDIDCCYDLFELPAGLCNLIHLRKLNITYCHELRALPEGFGNLTNLEVLRLHSCTKLYDLPESIGSLQKLRFLDMSDCLRLGKLPTRMDKLCGLRTLHMRGCRGLEELPTSVMDLKQLKDVICDEETAYLWEPYESYLVNLKINVLKEDINLNWLHNFHP